MAELRGMVALVAGWGGWPMAVALARRGARVVLGLREVAGSARVPGVEVPGVEVVGLDLADVGSVRAAAAGFLRGHDRLHLLVLATPAPVGAVLLTNLLLETLRASAPARIVTVSGTGTCRRIRVDGAGDG